MSEVVHSSSHYIVEDRPEGLVVTMPAGRRRGVAMATVAFLIWLVVELLGFDYLTRIYPIQARQPGSEAYPPHGLLVLWTLLGLLLLAGLLWQILGETVIDIGSAGIRLQRRLLGIGPARTYLRQYVQGLRAEHELGYQTYMADRRRSSTGPVQRPTYQVVFDYGLKVVRFGSGMDQEEAAHLVEVIAARFPQYGGETCSTL